MRVADTHDDDFEEFEDRDEMVIHIRWIADGSKTLVETAESLEKYAEFLRNLEREGWVLTGTIENDIGFLRKVRP